MEEVFRQITMIALLTLVGFTAFKLKILNAEIKSGLTEVKAADCDSVRHHREWLAFD